MTWILGIDIFHHVAVGLVRDGESVVSEVVAGVRTHGEALTLLIQRLCALAGIAMTGIGAYAVGIGSGPPAGLHVGVVAVHTLVAMAGRPLHGARSLDVIAAQWQDAPDEFVAVSDARRKEFYWALYHNGIRVGKPRVSVPGAIPDLPAAGPVLDDPAGPRHLDAAVLAAHQADLSSVDGEPFYLRAAGAAASGTRKSASLRLRVPR